MGTQKGATAGLRFRGAHGRDALIAAIEAQSIVKGDVVIARALSRVAKVRLCKRNSRLIQQGASDNEIYLLLLGQFGIHINNRPLAIRYAGQTVGEMALIDSRAKRSATVVALEDSVVASISASAFSRVATRFPTLWRNLAMEMADRLRQRNQLVRQRNSVLQIFIGSSSESLPIAKAIQRELKAPTFAIKLWTDNVFRPSDVAIDALERVAYEADFGVLVLGPDDKIQSSGKLLAAPRDNVIFELGLLMGAMGRKRTFFAAPISFKIKIPSDLQGVTYLPYKFAQERSLPGQVRLLCDEIRKAISLMGAR